MMKAYRFDQLHKMVAGMMRREFEKKEYVLRKLRDGRKDNG